MKPNSCPICAQRELEIALRERDYDRLREILTEMEKAKLPQFKRDLSQPVAVLTQRKQA